MIDFYHNYDEGKTRLAGRGSPIELAADIAVCAMVLFARTKAASPTSAETLKAALKALAVALLAHALIDGAFGGEQNLVAEALDGVAECRFAVGIAVVGCGIEIVDAVLVGVGDHFIDLFLIDKVLLALVVFGKAHAAKAKGGDLFSGVAKIAVIHRYHFLSCLVLGI